MSLLQDIVAELNVERGNLLSYLETLNSLFDDMSSVKNQSEGLLSEDSNGLIEALVLYANKSSDDLSGTIEKIRRCINLIDACVLLYCDSSISSSGDVSDFKNKTFNILDSLSIPSNQNIISKLKEPEQLASLRKMPGSMTEIIYKRIQQEPQITQDVKAIVKADNGKLGGIDFRIKTPSSIYEKIYLRERAGLTTNTDKEAVEKVKEMYDIIRYTEIHDCKTLASAANASIAEYESRGYTIVQVKNTWADESPTYRGINVKIKDPRGVPFEVQYHTQESFDLKNGELHEIYEKQRLLIIGTEKYIEYESQMIELSGRLTVPDNIDEVKNR